MRKSMKKSLRVLLVEDSQDDALLILRQLANAGYDTVHERVETAEGMDKALQENNWDLVLCDYQMPRFDGLSAISILKKTSKDIPLIIVSGTISPERAVEAMKAGAGDYIMKDNLSRLVPVIERELKELEMRRKARLVEYQREKALEALRKEKRLNEILVQSSPAFFVAIDSDGKTIMMNDALLSQLGYRKEEVVGLDYLSSFVPEGDRQKLTEVIEGKLWHNDHSINESRILTKDGRELLVEWHGRPVFRESGELDFFFGLGIDITERKKSQEVLRRSEERFRLFSELAPVGIVIADHEERLIYVNRKFVDLFGYDKEVIDNVDKWWTIACPDGSLRERASRQWRRDVREALGSGREITPREYPVKCADGSIRQVEFRLAASDDFVILVCSDVTESKMLEAQLARAQKLDSVGTLAGGIAHDFNNLLMGIQGHISLMLIDLSPSHPHYERLKCIEEQVAGGAKLTKQLLGFARGGSCERRVVSMNDVVDKTAAMFGRTKKEIVIHRKFAPGLWSTEVDRTGMEQVLMNLYINAWQAMPLKEAKYLSLETENVILGEEEARLFDLPAGSYVRISVTDTGEGMDEWTRERIFDPFFSTKPRGRGTGLGLATAYGIIQSHGGMIDVRSERGEGSTFTIYLPASTKEPEKEISVQPSETFHGTETILLVDDEKTVLDVSRELLETLGYSVYTASSGMEAIALFAEKKDEIDLVILDMIMPGISGGKTFDRLREIDPGVPVILASGYSMDGDAANIMSRGCDTFLQKPFLMSQLSGAIKETLDSRRQQKGGQCPCEAGPDYPEYIE